MKNVLIAARTAEACRTLAGFITGDGYDVTTATDGMTIRSIDIGRFGYIFISVPLENENGFELMSELRRRTDAYLFAIVREEAADAAAKRLSDIGAFIVTKPVFKSSLMQAIRFCETHAGNETVFRRRIAELEQQAERDKKLNRAKLIVMTKEQLSEDEAHRRIQKLAMDLRISQYEIAEDIINGLLI